MSDSETQPPSPRRQQDRTRHVSQPRDSSRTQSTIQQRRTNALSTAARRTSSLGIPTSTRQTTADQARRTNVLRDLQAIDEARHGRLDEYNDSPDDNLQDEEEDSEMPLYDEYYEAGGSEAIRTMTNFTGSEFCELYDIVKDKMASEFSSGRGRRSAFSNGDILLMTLTTLKSGTDWDTSCRPFNISTSAFIRLVVRCIECISSVVYEEFVKSVSEKYPMHEMIRNEQTFESFKYARYATDVTCHQINRPSGNMEEVRGYYSAKHKYYGYKTEVSVLPNGLAISSSSPRRGATADLRILQSRQRLHLDLLKKGAGSSLEDDEDPLAEKYSQLYAMLCDKGYQGAAEFLRCISPFKKPRNRGLLDREETFNAKVARDRIIVEHFFGRLQGLWGIMDHKWTWRESIYDEVANLCIGLTNFHIEKRPLRREDRGRFNRARNRRLSIARSQVATRRATVQSYIQSRRARRGEQSRALEADE